VELVGASSLGPLLLVGSKALLVSCVDTEQADLACAAIDCGFLLAVGSLSAVVVRDGNRAGKLDALVDPLMQLGLGHIALEMIFNGVLLDRLKPGNNYKLTPDLWVHHIAALGCGVFTVLSGNAMGGDSSTARKFVMQGCRMAATECTAGLPISFSQALKFERLSGWRSIALGATMAGTFVWRTLHSRDILREYNNAVRASRKGGAKGVPHAWVGRLAAGTIAGGNAIWTFRIFKGLYKKLRGSKKKKSDGYKTVWVTPPKGRRPADDDE
jgi:hypothetical protein